MKKLLLLSLLAAGALCASAAHPGQKLMPKSNPKFQSVTLDATTVSALHKASGVHKASESVNSVDFTLAYDPYTAVGFNNGKAGDLISMAFEITPDVATQFAGNEITSVFFYQGLRAGMNSARNYVTESEVFLTYDLQGEPFATAKAKTTTTAWDKIVATLDKPYTIEAGKSVYVGVTNKIKNKNDYTVVVDYMYHNTDEGGWIAFNGEWDNISEYYGFCNVGAVVEGDHLPTNNGYLTEYSLMPYQVAGQMIESYVKVRNGAANLIENVEIEFQAGEETPITEYFELEEPISYGQEAYVDFNGLSYPTPGPDVVYLNATLKKVNGVEVSSDPIQSAAVFIDKDNAYDRTVVIEEYTSNTCGYCPYGIVGMEYVHDNYTRDQVIGIAVHGNMSGPDPMLAESYQEALQYYSGGSFPSSYLNRMLDAYPEKEELAYYIDVLRSFPTIAKVTGTSSFNDDQTAVVVNTSSVFSFDYDKLSFAMEYVLIEDNVGPYPQTNYLSGQNADCGDWTKKPSTASTIYQEVARVLDTFGGVSGSVPETIKANETYEYTHEVKIPDTVENTDELHAIAMLVDIRSGVIINAVQMEIKPSSGINDLLDDNASAPVEFFNLQGVRVAQPENGLFIRRQGSKVEKVVM